MSAHVTFFNLFFSRNPKGPAAQQYPEARTELRDHSSHMAFPTQAQEVSQHRGEPPPHLVSSLAGVKLMKPFSCSCDIIVALVWPPGTSLTAGCCLFFQHPTEALVQISAEGQELRLCLQKNEWVIWAGYNAFDLCTRTGRDYEIANIILKWPKTKCLVTQIKS